MLDDALPLNGRRLEQCFDRILRASRAMSAASRGATRPRIRSRATTSLAGGSTSTWSRNTSAAPRARTTSRTRAAATTALPRSEPGGEGALQGDCRSARARGDPAGHPDLLRAARARGAQEDHAHHRRLFLGWRATNAHEPLFGQQQTDAWIQSQAPAKIKSGQATDIFPSAYVSYPKNYEARTKFSVSVFVPQCLYRHRVASGEHEGQEFVSVLKNMKGLADYGLPLHRAYDELAPDHVPKSACEALLRTPAAASRSGSRPCRVGDV